MKVTIDANVLFSALIKQGITRKILFNPELGLYSPSFLFIEIDKYKPLLLKKFSGKEEEFEGLMQKIVSQIQIIPDQELKPFLYAAKSLSKDEKDWLYLACALKEDTIIWSNDKDFKKQNKVKVFSTNELLKEFKN